MVAEMTNYCICQLWHFSHPHLNLLITICTEFESNFLDVSQRCLLSMVFY